ncbi:hypothetical protein ASE63_00725 [Bosea sp. Root381]|jgi:hypothetical protein|uniref:type II toxin-antitoxin system VapB family antitoxin n=1 Tax=Bosea sp. Root381 TaxID=1736524 RepID=UPI0006FA07F0|nr:type II toxin-antitoxin system VapB family antitoxin [Bosea sp. Root381]KRE17761.1 hypothetical protein ASE63_00725 [Bosea sp. Root381]
MGILVRDPNIDRMVRELAANDGISLQAAIGLAVERELRRRKERFRQIEDAVRVARAMMGNRPVIDDGLTHKEFFDREYGDA